MSSRHGSRSTEPNFDDVDVVSFDLFETLILRPFEDPADGFELLETLALSLSNGALPDFRSARVEAKRWTDERVGEEVPLGARYRAIARRFDLATDVTTALMNAELDLELRTARPSRVVKTWFDAALAAGKTVCILSDTYYPREFVERLLTSGGYSGWHRLYVSAELGVLKSSGRMFERLLTDLAVPPDRILHIGDHPVSDGRKARELGIRTWSRPAPRELFAAHARAAQTLPTQTLHERTLRGLIARRFATDWATAQPASYVGPHVAQLGYSLLGPMLLGFSTWLIRELRRSQRDAVFFLARDGRVMKQAYDLLRSLDPTLPHAEYVWASRRGTLLPSLRTTEDFARLVDLPGSMGPLSEFLKRRFGVDGAELAQLVPSRFGFDGWSDPVHPARHRGRLLELLDALAPSILERASDERAALLAYYEERGLRSARYPALVDLGHQGSLQLALTGLSERTDLLGLYFATVAAIDRLPRDSARSYVGAASGLPGSLGLYQPRLQMFELLFPSDEGSFVRLARDGDAWRAETFTPEGDEPRQAFCRQVHEAALEFLRDVVQVYGERTLDLETTGEAALAPYLDFLSRPTRADARCFSQLRVENAFGGRQVAEVLDPRVGIWPEGVAALGRPDDQARFAPFLRRALGSRWSSRRLRKLLRDPRAFLVESRFGALRWLGRLW